MTSKSGMLWHWMRGQRLRFAVAIAFMGISVLLLFLAPLISRAAIDGIIRQDWTAQSTRWILRFTDALGGRDSIARSLWIAGLGIIAVTALGGLFSYLRGRCVADASESIIQNLRNQLYDHLQHLPCPSHDKAHTGDLVQRCTSDAETVRTFYTNQIVEIGRAAILLIAAVPILVLLDWRMALAALALMPVIIAFACIFFAKVQKSFKDLDEAEGAMTTVLQENLSGIRVVRAFARHDFERHKFAQRNTQHRDLGYRLFKLMASYWALSDLLCLTQTALVLFVGAWLVSRGHMSIGTLVAFITYVGMIVWPVRQMGRILADLGKAMVALGRIHEILAQPRESQPPSAPPNLPARLTGQIVFRNVEFAHGEKRILQGISLSIQPGESLAILGPSGSGKSTLINLLLRLYDYDRGSITLDGYELKSLNRGFVRSQFGVVMQEPFLYSKTLRENIRIGRHSATDDDVISAATAACIHQSIIGFDKQYDTLVGERGVTLSGGQRQRVAIARALLQNAPILILDDALSAVDTRTETLILGALRQRRGRHTTLIIAHRLSTLQNADRIIVIEHGRIEQSGTHAELVNQDGLYRRLWQIQGTLEEDLSRELVELKQPTLPTDDAHAA